MTALIGFLKRHPFGVATPLLMIASALAGDFNWPSPIRITLQVSTFIAFFAHFFTVVGPYFSKKISYGEAIVNLLGPVMIIWVPIVLVRACIMALVESLS